MLKSSQHKNTTHIASLQQTATKMCRFRSLLETSSPLAINLFFSRLRVLWAERPTGFLLATMAETNAVRAGLDCCAFCILPFFERACCYRRPLPWCKLHWLRSVNARRSSKRSSHTPNICCAPKRCQQRGARTVWRSHLLDRIVWCCRRPFVACWSGSSKAHRSHENRAPEAARRGPARQRR